MVVKKLYSTINCIKHTVVFNMTMVIIARRVRASMRIFNFFFTLQKTVLPWCVHLEYMRTAYNNSRAFTYISRTERKCELVARSVIQIYYTCIALCIIMCTHSTRILYIIYACVL